MDVPAGDGLSGLVVEDVGQGLVHGFGGVFNVQGNLGVADGVHFLLGTPELQLLRSELRLPRNVTLGHGALDVAADLHFPAVKLAHVDGDVETVGGGGGRQSAAELVLRVDDPAGDGLDPGLRHGGEVRLDPELGGVQLGQDTLGPLQLQIDRGLAVRQEHKAPFRQGGVLPLELDGNVADLFAGSDILGDVHVDPDAQGHQDRDYKVKTVSPLITVHCRPPPF